MKRLVEFRTYRLKPGTGTSFHELIAHQSANLMRSWGMDVVAAHQSMDDADAYMLVRAYDNIEHLHTSQDTVYANDTWRKGPREAVLARIDNNINVVMWLTEEGIEALRTAPATQPIPSVDAPSTTQQ